MDINLLLSQIMSVLFTRIVVPEDFPSQAIAVKEMLKNDLTGIVDSLTDFLVSSASVDFSIETQSENYNKLFSDWLEGINLEYEGRIPIGINELAKEYYKERWKGASFPILKIAKWDKISGTDLIFPTKMYFVDGGSIRAKEKENTSDLKLISYDYFIGDTEKTRVKLEKDVVFATPYGRWFDKYPIPYLIKRGIYNNWKIIHALKNKETEILEQIIPYLLLIKKGSAELFRDAQKTYSDTELQQVVQDLQEELSNYRNTKVGDKQIKSPVRATNFDETIEQLIPNLETIFNPKLFEQAERNILSGLGFIDIIQGVSSTRRESVLNPKAFMQELESGVVGFENVIKQLTLLIKLKNDSHIKYNASNIFICHSPIKTFQTDEFKNQIRLLWERGGISKKTYVELVGDNVDFETETFRREKETKSGIDYIMYPPIIKNDEDKGIDFVNDPKEEDKNGKPIANDKIDDKQKYNMGMIDEDLVVASLNEEDEIDLDISFEPRVTERYVRLRQADPKSFDKNSFRTVIIDEKKRVKAIIGKIKGEKTTKVQSFIFVKEKWNTKEAQEWVTKHKGQHDAELAEVELITSPYHTNEDLPPAVKKKLSPKQQTSWRKAWMRAYSYYLQKTGNHPAAETMAFKVAWSVIKKMNSSEKTFLNSIKNFFNKNEKTKS